MADIVTNTLQIGNNNLILRDADAQEKVAGLMSAFNNNAYSANLCGSTPLELYPVSLKQGDIITVSTSDGSTVPVGTVIRLRIYDANKTQVDYYSIGNGISERAISIPSNISYITIDAEYTVPFMVNKGNTALPYTPYFPGVKKIQEEIEKANADIGSINSQIPTINSRLSDLNSKIKIFKSKTTYSNEGATGYCDSSGTIVENGGWKHLILKVNEIKNLYYTGYTKYTATYGVVFRDENGTAISTALQGGSDATYYTKEPIAINTSAYDVVISFWLGANYSYIDYEKTIDKTVSNLAFPWSEKKWVVFGDSLTEENQRTTKHYFDYVSDVTGIGVYNMGNSGSGYASEYDIGTAFPQRIGDVPTDADVITIFGSFNDLSEIGSTVTLGTASDSGTTTIGGLINLTLDNLFTAFPLANVGLVTPCPWQGANPTTEPNTASAYCQLIVDICNRRGIPCLDLFHCSQLRPWEASFRALAYTKDDGGGTHPDETGHKIIAPRFKGFLDTLLI